MKYNFINSKTVISCVNKELRQVENKEFLKELYEICLQNKYNLEDVFKDIDIGYGYGIDRVSIPYGEEEEKEIEKEVEVEEYIKAADDENSKLSESIPEGFLK